MDFDWTEGARELRRDAVDFAARHLVEGVRERDRGAEFSREAWDACGARGLPGLLVPQRWGGAGHDLLAAVAILEGLGYGGRDNGLIFSLAAHAASCEGTLAAFGSDEQKERWLRPLAEGRAIGATGMTEAESGSSALSLATQAVQDGDEWVLDGGKVFVTNAPIADVLVIYARTGGGGFAGLTAFLVSADNPGMRIGEPIEKMGLRTSPMAEIHLEGCRLPASAVIGKLGSGAMMFSQTMDMERLLVMAPAVGVMERLLERCVEHARRRRPGGVAIGKHQAVAHAIADMELRLESARLLLYRAAWHRLRHGTATRESALAKLAVSEAYVANCRAAVQIFGGYGYMVETELERELRDALATTLYVGTSEIQRNLIAGLRGLG